MYLRRAAAWGATAHRRAADSIAIRDIMGGGRGDAQCRGGGHGREIVKRDRVVTAQAMEPLLLLLLANWACISAGP